MPERWPRKLSAVRSAASSAAAGPLASSTSAGTASRHWPSTTSLSTCSTPHWRIVSATSGEAEDDARPAFCTIRARARASLGHRRLRGHIAGADVLGQRTGDRSRFSDSPGLGHRAHPRSTSSRVHFDRRIRRGKALVVISRSTRRQRLIHEVTELPPFQTLLDEHAADVMAVLRGAVGRTDADDCFQETFLAALRAYPKLSDAGNLRGWLLTIAHRKAIDHHRANGPPAAAGRRGRGGRGRGPASPTTAIWALVGALPPKQRAAVTLRYASDLPHAEIAAALGCSPEAARRSLHEGMKRLRKELA